MMMRIHYIETEQTQKLIDPFVFSDEESDTIFQ